MKIKTDNKNKWSFNITIESIDNWTVILPKIGAGLFWAILFLQFSKFVFVFSYWYIYLYQWKVQHFSLKDSFLIGVFGNINEICPLGTILDAAFTFLNMCWWPIIKAMHKFLRMKNVTAVLALLLYLKDNFTNEFWKIQYQLANGNLVTYDFLIMSVYRIQSICWNMLNIKNWQQSLIIYHYFDK